MAIDVEIAGAIKHRQEYRGVCAGNATHAAPVRIAERRITPSLAPSGDQRRVVVAGVVPAESSRAAAEPKNDPIPSAIAQKIRV